MIIILNRASNGRKYFTVVVFLKAGGDYMLYMFIILIHMYKRIGAHGLSISNLLKLKLRKVMKTYKIKFDKIGDDDDHLSICV